MQRKVFQVDLRGVKGKIYISSSAENEIKNCYLDRRLYENNKTGWTSII